jgi:hypothetical protein
VASRLYAIYIVADGSRKFVTSRLYAIYVAADEIFKFRDISALRDLYRRREYCSI